MIRKLTRRRSDTMPQLRLGAFGKHPAWDDHIPDLGLETERLTQAKQVLYVQGIGGNIDSGAWDEISPERTLPGFHHFFGWYDQGSWVFGRIWSSVDGKGRSRYPMVVCLESPHVSCSEAAPLVFERLERLEDQCRSAQTGDEVGAILSRHSAEMRTDMTTLIGSDDHPSGMSSLATLAQCTEMGADRTGLIRLLYHIDRDLPECCRQQGESDRKTTWRTRGATLSSSAMRVPRCADSASGAFVVWATFLRQMMGEGVPMWVICPIDADWVDLLLGPVTTSHFFCLRVPPVELPLTTEVPYSVDDEFAERTRQLVEEATNEAIHELGSSNIG